MNDNNAQDCIYIRALLMHMNDNNAQYCMYLRVY